MRKILAMAATAIAGAAYITAGPAGLAAAEPELNGPYVLTWDLTQASALKDPKVQTEQWNITPCGSGCAHVTPERGTQGDMHLVNGRWEMTRENSLINCHPPSPDTTMVLSLDAGTLQGMQDTTNHCAGMSYGGPASLAPA